MQIMQMFQTSHHHTHTHTHTHTHVHISLDYIVWIGKGLINQLVHPPMRWIYLSAISCQRGELKQMYGRMLSTSGLGFPTPTKQEILIPRNSAIVCGMLIGNYYTPKDLVEATPEAQELPEGPITGPQNTETQLVVSLAIVGEGGECMLVHLNSIHDTHIMLPSYACVVLFTYSLSQYATLPQPVM